MPDKAYYTNDIQAYFQNKYGKPNGELDLPPNVKRPTLLEIDTHPRSNKEQLRNTITRQLQNNVFESRGLHTFILRNEHDTHFTLLAIDNRHGEPWKVMFFDTKRSNDMPSFAEEPVMQTLESFAKKKRIRLEKTNPQTNTNIQVGAYCGDACIKLVDELIKAANSNKSPTDVRDGFVMRCIKKLSKGKLARYYSKLREKNQRIINQTPLEDDIEVSKDDIEVIEDDIEVSVIQTSSSNNSSHASSTVTIEINESMDAAKEMYLHVFSSCVTSILKDPDGFEGSIADTIKLAQPLATSHAEKAFREEEGLNADSPLSETQRQQLDNAIEQAINAIHTSPEMAEIKSYLDMPTIEVEDDPLEKAAEDDDEIEVSTLSNN